jgi:hypothetical protein
LKDVWIIEQALDSLSTKFQKPCQVFFETAFFDPFALHFDLIWFGLIMLISLDVGFLTPPFGMTLFVMKGISPPELGWMKSIEQRSLLSSSISLPLSLS